MGLVFVACGGTPVDDTAVDGSLDGTLDSTSDVAADVTPKDATADAGDASGDATSDAADASPSDAGADAHDAEPDASDAALDAPAEASLDAGGCVDNTACAQSEYCEKGTGNCNGVGVCTPRPQVCSQLFNPVCGCDKQTHTNACFAHSSGTSVDYTGSCE